MEVKTKIKLKDWGIMAFPKKNGSDTTLFLKYAKDSNLTIEPKATSKEQRIFNDKVALRHFKWETNFLNSFEHAPFNHSSIKEAEDLVALWPEVHRQFGALIQAFNPMLIKGVEDKKSHSSSNSHQPDATLGAVWATVHNPVLLAQAFVHELAHNKLFALGQHFIAISPLFKNESNEVFDSPIRLDIPRPISAVFHGVYAFTHVLALDNILFEKGSKKHQKQCLNLMKLNALRVKKGLDLIQKCAKLTIEGEAFMNPFYKWATQEITKALKTYGKNVSSKTTPIIIIGPNSQQKDKLVKKIAEKTKRKVVSSTEKYLEILSQSSVVKQKKQQIYGSLEVMNLLEQSNKFSNELHLKNWLIAGIFNKQELEFMNLQLANQLLKDENDVIISFDEDHVFLEQPKFLDRLNRLFKENEVKVIYVRPVLNLEESKEILDEYNSEERKNKIHKLLYAEAYRKISDYTFDTQNIDNKEVVDELTTLIHW